MQGGGSGQLNPPKPERPPLSKKSKTMSSNSDDSRIPDFPGVRCLPSTPSSTCATSSTSTTMSSSAATSSGSDAFSFNFSDRDYVFPSNLGGYSSRRNVSVKSSSSFSKSQQQQSPPLPERSASMPPSLRSGGGGGGGGDGGLTSLTNKSKLRAEKDLKVLSSSLGLIPALTEASASANRHSVNSSAILKNSWKVNLVSCYSL